MEENTLIDCSFKQVHKFVKNCKWKYKAENWHDNSIHKITMSRGISETISFLAQLGSGILSIECFPLTYDLNDFKSRVNRHLLTVGSF